MLSHTPLSTPLSHSDQAPTSQPGQGEDAIAFLANLYGNPTSYGYLKRKDGGWFTVTVSADKGEKKLPETIGKNGKRYFLLPLKPETIATAYRNGEVIGKRPGAIGRGQTRHLTLDIDRKSQYHPENDLAAWSGLVMSLESWGLSFAVVTSSDSGGLHILIPFSEAIWSGALATQIERLLGTEGYQIAFGQLETFPNRPKGGNDTQMNGCRLPCISPDSYPVDPCTLERLGWRDELVETLKGAIAVNGNGQKFLHLEPAAPTPAPTPVEVSVESSVEPAAPTPAPAPTEAKPAPRPKPRGFGEFVGKAKFWLSNRFHWSESNRSNQVIGAHTAYVIEVLGITDPVEAEIKIWERLRSHGYAQNASKDEQKDRDHVRRWIASCLKKGNITPLGKNPGRGDDRINERRSADSRHRLRLALKGLRSQSFKTGTALFEAVNSWLRERSFSGLGKGTFQKLKMFWVGLLVRCRLAPPTRRSTPPLDQQVGQDDPAVARVEGSSSPPSPPPDSPPRGGESGQGGRK